jgi:protein SCO1/2
MSPRAVVSRHAGRARALASCARIALLALGCAALAADRPRLEPLPVLGRVADFDLVDQSSAHVSRAALDGAPWVASFVFTRCTSVCPRLTERMRALQALAQGGDRSLRLVTFSVDPQHDGPDVLRSYAEAHGASAARWKFLTGSEVAIESVARSFSVALDRKADPDEPDLGIMHSGHLVLVDGRGRIRGYYPSSDAGVERRIVDDLQRIDA